MSNDNYGQSFSWLMNYCPNEQPWKCHREYQCRTAKSWFILSDLKSSLESGRSNTSISEMSKPKSRKFVICSGSQNLVDKQQNLGSLHQTPMLELSSFCQLVIVYTGYCCYFMNFYLLKPSIPT